MLRLRYVLTALALACSFSAFALFLPTQTVMVKMTDGTELATDCYLPKEGGPSWPVIVARSAYPKIVATSRAARIVKDGYAVVMQDIRGMGFSKGERNIWYADGWRAGLQDGADTIAWVKSQPWCNGKIATSGESALGVTQVLLAPTTHDVACQVIEVAPSNFYHNLAFHGGVWVKSLDEGWLTLLGLKGSMAQYKAHPAYDDFWTYYNAEAKAPEVTEPALHIGGWFDIFQQGTINNFVTRQHNGGPGAKGNQKLIMRPSAHAGYDARDYKFNSNVRELRIGQIEDQFYAHWLKGEQNGVMEGPKVHYYVLGDDTAPNAPGNVWRTADDWPPFPTVQTPFYLSPLSHLGTEVPEQDAKISFVYDPATPTPTYGGSNLLLPGGPFDQRRVSSREGVLKFASEPLTAPLEVTGQVTVKLYVSTDAPDTDFAAKLIDVYPQGDGREILVLDGIQRLKFRKSFEKVAPPPASADEVLEVTIDLWSISWIFNTGHRIGVQVSSSNYPRFEINPNTGDDFPTGGAMRVAHNVVHCGKDHPSAALLPVPK